VGGPLVTAILGAKTKKIKETTHETKRQKNLKKKLAEIYKAQKTEQKNTHFNTEVLYKHRNITHNVKESSQ